jgi:hypothetical protein
LDDDGHAVHGVVSSQQGMDDDNDMQKRNANNKIGSKFLTSCIDRYIILNDSNGTRK